MTILIQWDVLRVRKCRNWDLIWYYKTYGKRYKNWASATRLKIFSQNNTTCGLTTIPIYLV